MSNDKQIIAQRFAIEIKSFFKFIVSNIKDNFDENGDTLIGSAGITGSVIKLFGQQKIDAYFEKISEKKLENFGVISYIKAAISCAENSVEAIAYDKDYIFAKLPNINDFLTPLDIKINEFDKLRLYLNPTFNPAIQEVKNAYISYLEYLCLDTIKINTFKKSFEEGIKQSIKDSFGNVYDEHLLEIKEKWFCANEEILLAQMCLLNRVGLQESESLDYEITYGKWCSHDAFSSSGLTSGSEKEQSNVAVLLEAHFQSKDEVVWGDIMTFIVADFGKGKSVFMKHYASLLAEKYLDTKAGPIPLYFNLNGYHSKKYNPSINRGIIESVLRKDYQIDIEDEYFKEKQFIFLIDSLDESGDLNLIHDVLSSIYYINKNAPLDSLNHKIVISSRPIDKELSKAISDYSSKLNSNNEAEFISLYGFKATQFDHWLKSSVYSRMTQDDMKQYDGDSVTELLFLGWKQNGFSAYETLLNNEVLGESELVKPLFAYILYQLLTNKINIPSNGRVGVYLAFLHYISSQAKFVKDSEIKLEDEHHNRKVLHAISALWNKQRSTGQNSVLSKNHISFSLLGKNKPDNQDVKEIEKIDELKFLSHSYFGDNEQHLHFQHQSFAEILLAEYYLKVFIIESLEYEANINETRRGLFVGEPTVETMQFFIELIKLLVGSVSKDGEVLTKIVKSKRKLLLPILGSLATPIFRGKLHSKTLAMKLYKSKDKLYPEDEILTESWPITEDVLNNLINLCSNILDQNNRIILAQSTIMTSLYDGELVLIEEEGDCGREDVDKWLAIALVGNIYKELVPRKYYFSDPDKAVKLFKLIQSSSKRSAPEWITQANNGVFHNLKLLEDVLSNNQKQLPRDLSLPEIRITYSGISISNFDFNNAIFKGIKFVNCQISEDLSNSTLEQVVFQDCFLSINFAFATLYSVSFYGSTMAHCRFDNIYSMEKLRFIASNFLNIALPEGLFQKSISKRNKENTNIINLASVIGRIYVKKKNGKILCLTNLKKRNSSLMSFIPLISFIESGIRLNIFTKEILNRSFEFMSEIDRDNFVSGMQDENKAIFTNIRNEPEYLILENEFQKQEN